MKLYHGSSYKTDILKPGIIYTGEKVMWDGTESNEWLYATVNEQDAVILGFFSYIEKNHDGISFQMNNKELVITSDLFDISGINIYLYSINKNDDWVLVDNKNNGYGKEYKTQSHIKPVSVTKVSMKGYLLKHRYTCTVRNEKGDILSVYPKQLAALVWGAKS